MRDISICIDIYDYICDYLLLTKRPCIYRSLEKILHLLVLSNAIRKKNYHSQTLQCMLSTTPTTTTTTITTRFIDSMAPFETQIHPAHLSLVLFP